MTGTLPKKKFNPNANISSQNIISFWVLNKQEYHLMTYLNFNITQTFKLYCREKECSIYIKPLYFRIRTKSQPELYYSEDNKEAL